jgi:DNA-binding transcriptional regulator GbsR (MarR family)
MPDMTTIDIEELRRVLARAIGAEPSSGNVDKIIHALDDVKLFRYHNNEKVNILSTPGKVFAAICLDPSLTQRALALYLGCSEALVEKSIKALVNEGLITKTKYNRRNVYQINEDIVRNHSDIQHFAVAFSKMFDVQDTGEIF